MAFQAAAGYNNLPLGNFSSTIYSKKAQLAFRKKSVVSDVTSSEYFGEISGQGDSVKILLEPTISVTPYTRGANIVSQDIIDNEFTLVVDKANAFKFETDDLESKHSHVNWEQMATSQAAYRLADNYDQEVLGYMCGYKQAENHQPASVARVLADIPGTKAVASADDDELLASMKISRPSFGNLTTAGSAGDSIPVAPRTLGETGLPTTFVSPLQVINRMSRMLTQQQVPMEGRFLIIDPVFQEVLLDEGSRIVNADFGGSSELKNGMINGNFYGFRVYMSHNMPVIGTGPATNTASAQATNFGVLIAGHDSAVATAEQINKVETFRSQASFGDVVRGMHVYGRKILRPEALVRAVYNLA